MCLCCLIDPVVEAVPHCALMQHRPTWCSSGRRCGIHHFFEKMAIWWIVVHSCERSTESGSSEGGGVERAMIRVRQFSNLVIRDTPIAFARQNVEELK